MIIAAGLGFSIVSMSQAISCILLLTEYMPQCTTTAPVPKGPITITCEMKAKCTTSRCSAEVDTNLQGYSRDVFDFENFGKQGSIVQKTSRIDYHLSDANMDFRIFPYDIAVGDRPRFQSGTITCTVVSHSQK